MSLHRASIEYRPDIDGLRALAIISVMVFHLFPTVLTGGFVGVDIFFVISGYLISAIIFSELQNQTFSFKSFYAKRIRRIFPALLIILIFTMIFGWIILFPSEFVTLGKHLKSATIFLSNRTLYKEAGYFDLNSEYKPLLHIWSLSLEEQFYILFPLSIFIIYKFRRYALHFILAGIALSFYLNLRYLLRNSPACYYSLPTRAWELLFGSLLAYIKIMPNQHAPILSAKIKNILALTAISTIISICVCIDNKTLFPGWIALLPTLASCLLIYTKNSWFNQKILAHKITVWIGLISYPLYLWHWPIISFARIMNGKELTIVARIIIFISSFILAYLTAYLIERPIRRLGAKATTGLIILMIIVYGLSIPIHNSSVTTKSAYLNPMINKIDQAILDWKYDAKYFENDPDNLIFFNRFGKGAEVTVFFGDSNMEQYWPRIEKLMRENAQLYNKHTAVFATYGGLAPIPRYKNTKYRHNEEPLFLSKAINYIKDPSVKTIVFAANWVGYLNQDSEIQKELYGQLEMLLVDLQKLRKKVYIILNIPISIEQDPRQLIRRRIFSRWEVSNNKSYPSELWFTKEVQEITGQLKQIAHRTGAVTINPTEYLCPNKLCIILDNDGAPCYKDGVHLNASYVANNAMFMDQILLPTDN